MNPVLGGQFVKPEVVMTHFHIREGDVVADFGTGTGFFLPLLSKAVGETGRVFACEIQKNLIETIGNRIHTQGLRNIQLLWCDLEESNGIKIGDSMLDVGILINTLFILEDKVAAIKEMARTLRTGAKFFVVDWSESFGGLGPTPEHVITADEVTTLLESHGFIFEREYPAGEHHYGLAFRKV